jgi:hypothetical protein
MKTIRQLIIFLLGTAAGLGLFSLFMSMSRRSDHPTQIAQNQTVQAALTPPPSQKASKRHRRGHARAHASRHSHAVNSETAEVRIPARPRRHRTRSHSLNSSAPAMLVRNRRVPAARQPESASTLAQAAPAPQAQPTPTLFKSIGYAERADGQLTAFIMQDDHVQVVRIGDRISERYRVTSITEEAVSAIDESSAQVAMTKAVPPRTSADSEVLVAQVTADSEAPRSVDFGSPAPEESVAVRSIEVTYKSIGYVEKHNGSVDAIVAEGDSVRLIPTRAAAAATRTEPAVEPHVASRTVEGASIHETKPPVTVASSGANNPEVPYRVPVHATIFRRVEYEDSFPADDESIPHESAVFPVREQQR